MAELERAFAGMRTSDPKRPQQPSVNEFAPKVQQNVAELFENIDPTKNLNETLSQLN